MEDESARTAYLADGYVLELCTDEDKIYCRKSDQTRKYKTEMNLLIAPPFVTCVIS